MTSLQQAIDLVRAGIGGQQQGEGPTTSYPEGPAGPQQGPGMGPGGAGGGDSLSFLAGLEETYGLEPGTLTGETGPKEYEPDFIRSGGYAGMVWDPNTRTLVRVADAPPAGGGSPSALMNAALAREKFERYDMPLLEETMQENQFQRRVSRLKAEQAAQAAAAQERQNWFSNMMTIGPSLSGGREHYGGFGPEGGYTFLNRLLGGSGEPVPISTIPIDLPPPSGADMDLVRQLLGGV